MLQKDLENQQINDTLDHNQSQRELLDQQNNSLVEEKLETSQPHEYSNGCTYDGKWRDGKRYGKGIYKWPSGTKY